MKAMNLRRVSNLLQISCVDLDEKCSTVEFLD